MFYSDIILYLSKLHLCRGTMILFRVTHGLPIDVSGLPYSVENKIQVESWNVRDNYENSVVGAVFSKFDWNYYKILLGYSSRISWPMRI